MLTHDHNDFPSDVFTVLAAAGATLTIGELLCAAVALVNPLTAEGIFICCTSQMAKGK